VGQRQDFEFVSTLADQFFRSPHIKKSFHTIDEAGLTGWEKWLQIEFAIYLESQDSIAGWKREAHYHLDGRVAAGKKKCSVDFVIKQKWKWSHLALEVKQIKSADRCVDHMVKDKARIAAIRGTQFDIRSVWSLGVHQFVDSDEAKRLAHYYADSYGVAFDPRLISSHKIAKTNYAYTIF